MSIDEGRSQIATKLPFAELPVPVACDETLRYGALLGDILSSVASNDCMF